MTARMNANLVGVLVNTVGPWIALPEPLCKHALQVLLGGAVVATGGTIDIEGSLDGATAFKLATWTIGTQTNGDIIFAIDKPVPFVRANLKGLTGGTTPTVTAMIASR